MNKKPSGLINAAAHVDTGKSEFIACWKTKNPDFARDLKKLPKDSLVDSLINQIIGRAYDEAVVKTTSQAQMEDLPVVDPQSFLDALLNGSSEDARSVVRDWARAEIARAGSDIERIRKIAFVEGGSVVGIHLRPKVDAAKKQKENLSAGRPLGAAAQKKLAADNNAKIVGEYKKLLGLPDYTRKTVPELAKYLEGWCKNVGIKQANGTHYSVATIITKITGKR